MNKQKPPLLDRIRDNTKLLSEHVVMAIMDPDELDRLNRRVLIGRMPAYALETALLVTKFVFFPYTLLRFAVNLGLFFTRKDAPSIGPLVKATDFFPAPKTRKLLKKMVADQGDHIETLTVEGRVKTARWIWISSWFLLVWYGCHGLITSVAKAIRGRAA